MAVKHWSITDADNDDADLSNNIRWTENQAPSTVNNSARAMMTQIKNWFDDGAGLFYVIPAGNVSVSSNAYTLSTTQGVEALETGLTLVFVAEEENDGTVTINVDSKGATALKQHDVALAPAAIKNNDLVVAVHDGTDFEMVFPRRMAGGALTLTDDTDGAGVGPLLSLFRDSASPADDDNLAQIKFRGNDSGGNSVGYAEIVGKILDATNGTEDGELRLVAMVGGSAAVQLRVENGIYTPNATSGAQGQDTINATDYYRDGVIMGGTLIAVVEDQQTSGTDGGTISSGADRTRVLNTEVFDLADVVSVGSNQITLDAGDYIIKWSAPARRVRAHQSFLYDVTGTAEVQRGTSEYADDVTGSESEPVEGTTRSFGAARVTPGSSNKYEIRHRCQSSNSGTGLGNAGGFGTEVYTRVEIYAV